MPEPPLRTALHPAGIPMRLIRGQRDAPPRKAARGRWHQIAFVHIDPVAGRRAEDVVLFIGPGRRSQRAWLEVVQLLRHYLPYGVQQGYRVHQAKAAVVELNQLPRCSAAASLLRADTNRPHHQEAA
jgi:hypothetical protein